MAGHKGIRARIAPTLKTALLNTGVYAMCRAALPSRSLAILRYHAVCDPQAGYADPGICVSPAAFERHVSYLASNYRVLSLPDAADRLQRGIALPTNAVAITFDDGYADNLGAARTLARYGLSATFYLTAGCLAGGAPFWPAEIRTLVNAMAGRTATLQVGGETVTLPLGDAAARRTAVSRLTKLFKGHPIPVREAMREQLRAQAGPVDVPSPMLTWDEVKEMYGLGMVIGSHTMTHPNLPNAGPADAARELTQSKATLEAAIGAPVTMFSYPNGGADRYLTPEIVRLVKEAGFAAATTSRNAFAGPRSDVFALERIQVSEQLEELVFALEIERFVFKPRPRPAEEAGA
jgi:peptidoglycan/xylan/chitin deacetylase (PgdA/CDA1 family)